MLKHKRSTYQDSDNDDDDELLNVSSKSPRIYGSNEDIFGTSDENWSSDDDDGKVAETTSDPWDIIVNESFQRCQSLFDEGVNELIKRNSDISEEEAEEHVFKSMKESYRSAIHKLLWFDAMKKDPIYKTIKKTVNRLIDTEQYEHDEALKYAMLKRKFLFDKILDTYDIPTTGDDSE